MTARPVVRFAGGLCLGGTQATYGQGAFSPDNGYTLDAHFCRPLAPDDLRDPKLIGHLPLGLADCGVRESLVDLFSYLAGL
jgi:hypothetical protein